MTWLKENLFSILSTLIAVYFLGAFHLQVGFPPACSLTPTGATYLGMFVFFTVLPFARRLKLGKLIEFERLREEIKEVRTETRELVSTVSVVANAVSNTIKQSVHFHLPGSEAERKAQEDLSKAIPPDPDPTQQDSAVLDYIAASEPDLQIALARLRIDLERELRTILGKRLTTDEPSRMRDRFLSARSLFRRLASEKQRYQNIQSSFDYVLMVCNAAIHGQRVPENTAHEALGMGIRILHELEKEAEV